MVVTNYLSVPSKHGLAKDCMVLAESEMFRGVGGGGGGGGGGVWVVLKLEWSPTTPPVESFRGRSSFHQPHPLIFLFLSLCGSPISIFPFFLASVVASFNPISVFPFFFVVASLLVSTTDALPVFLLYFGCYER